MPFLPPNQQRQSTEGIIIWIINIRLKYFPKQWPTIVFSQNKFRRQFLDIKLVQKVCARGTTQHYSGASGHKWTACTISIDYCNFFRLLPKKPGLPETILQAFNCWKHYYTHGRYHALKNLDECSNVG